MRYPCVYWAALGLALSISTAFAGNPEPRLNCEGNPTIHSGLSNYCEMREMPAAFAGKLDIEVPVGGIAIRGWDEPDVLIRIQVNSAASNDWAARVLASAIQVTENAGVVRVTGPAQNRDQDWNVSLEVFVPRAVDLALQTMTGGISLQDVAGAIRCSTNVGGIRLESVGGDVKCHTAVGGISAMLTGDRWDGAGLEVETNVGGIDLRIPAGYNAHLNLATDLGSIKSNVALPIQRKGLGRSVTADWGSGGAPLKAHTRIGGMVITVD